MISKLIEETLDLYNFNLILIFYSVLFDNYHRLFYLFVEEHTVDRSKEFGIKYNGWKVSEYYRRKAE